jgi:hypothetical protein
MWTLRAFLSVFPSSLKNATGDKENSPFCLIEAISRRVEDGEK